MEAIITIVGFLGAVKNFIVKSYSTHERKFLFKALTKIQLKHNSVGWTGMQHSADYVELAMYGPGSQLLKPFIKNTDLHYLMLEAAEVENTF